MNDTRNVQINVRLPDEVASELDALAEQEHISRTDLTRQILLDGLSHRKRTLALRLYHEGKASKSRAAEIAGISLWEMMELIDRAALPTDYTIVEAVEEIRSLFTRV